MVNTCMVHMQKWDTAESLLYVCRRLWGQPYVGPVYTLLLHQWLLLNKDAGGTEQRQKHVNVLVSGKLLPAATQSLTSSNFQHRHLCAPCHAK